MTENSPAAKYTAVKPAKLTRGKTPQPLLHLGRKLGKKSPSISTKTEDATSDKEDESVNDGATEEQVIIVQFSRYFRGSVHYRKFCHPIR